jgi:hypothetical protein
MWQLRADFSQLASEGRIQCDELSGTWTPVGAPLKNVG